MRPLDSVLDDPRDEDFIGGSLDSYRYAGALWALPIDGATQAAMFRPDLLADTDLPRDWQGMLALGRDLRARGLWLGLATVAPHGFLALLALCANLGRPLSADPLATPFERATLIEAAGLLRAAAMMARPDGRQMNAIDLHDAMVNDDDLAFCPCAYAYLTYAEADMRRPLRFAGFRGPAGTPRGTVLGGTGLGITRGCRDPNAAARFLRLLSDWPGQRALVMHHHGQPGRVEAWQGAAEDAAFGGAHAALRETMEAAWTRPRFAGFVGIQHQAGVLVEAFLENAFDAAELARRLGLLWDRAEERPGAC